MTLAQQEQEEAWMMQARPEADRRSRSSLHHPGLFPLVAG